MSGNVYILGWIGEGDVYWVIFFPWMAVSRTLVLRCIKAILRIFVWFLAVSRNLLRNSPSS